MLKEVSGGYENLNWVDDEQDSTWLFSGHKFRIEYKRYLPRKAKSAYCTYLAIEGFYSQAYIDLVGRFKASGPHAQHYRNVGYSSSLNIYKEAYTVDKRNVGLNFIIGDQSELKHGFYLDAYGGIGFSHRVIRHLDRNHPTDRHVRTYFLFPELMRMLHPDKEGYAIVLSIPLNVKIGYKF